MKQAGIMIIIKDGLILGISRRHNKSIFGLPGGGFDSNLDRSTMDTAIRETKEEVGLTVKSCQFVYDRFDDSHGKEFHCHCYYAIEWEGTPIKSEDGEVKWMTLKELTDSQLGSAAFADYNFNTFKKFREMFPAIELR